MLHRILFLTLLAAFLSFGQEPPTDPKKAWRLKSVTWDLIGHRLVWVMEWGNIEHGVFTGIKTDTYAISPDEAVMAFANEKRGFTKTEARALHRLLDTLSQYCAESVVWWDKGEGERLNKDGNPLPQEKDKQPKPPPTSIGTKIAYHIQQ